MYEVRDGILKKYIKPQSLVNMSARGTNLSKQSQS